MEVFILFFSCFSVCSGMNALVACPGMIKSLNNLVSQVAFSLADAGHNVTFISSFPITHENPNVKVIETFSIDQANVMFEARSSAGLITKIFEIGAIAREGTWSNQEIMAEWKERKKFDLLITLSYYSEFLFPFLIDFPGVFVQFCTPGVEAVSLSREGNWLPPSVFPALLLNYDNQMTFMERVINLPATIGFYFMQKLYLSDHQKALQVLFPELENIGNYYDRVALTLINGHFALDGPVPLLPSQVEIGTITARKPKPLPKDLADFVDGSGEAGVVYFSLGSIAKSADIPVHAKKAFVEAFKRIPQRVIWKYEGDDLDLSPNVMKKKWLPQQDILGHPKTRVFISHCGNIGTQEAKYHGVPVLGVPIAFDQPRNGARMERKGLAIMLQWEDITPEKIVDGLNELINNPSYKEKLETISRVLQDQKETPAERAVWWLEYVVRHKGAPHLEYAGKRLSLFQYLMLDVLLFWAGVLCVFILAIVWSIRAICCRRRSSSRVSPKKKKN